MSRNEPDFEQLQQALVTTMHRHWPFCLAEGILLVVLGLVAIVFSHVLAVQILFGTLFLCGGLAGLVTTLWVPRVPGFFWSLVSAILGIMAGMLLLLQTHSVLSLTLILIVIFLIEGIASIKIALEHKRQMSGPWVWLLLSGVIDLILAAILLVGLPGSAGWALGLVVGINFIIGGLALAAMAISCRATIQGPVAPTP
jgi:uncharacterized membrane protein HdeD (DUF308 family)